MINNTNIKAVVKYESVQVIFPYELLKALNASTGAILWYEARYADNSIPAQPFTSEEAARAYIISQITHKESIHK